jgi:hypothetical protein
MTWILVLALAAPRDDLPVRVAPLPPRGSSKTVTISCPVGAETRLVLPEPLLTLKASPGAAAALGVEAAQARPFGIVELHPVRPGQGTLEIRGPSLLVTIVVEAGPSGSPSEIRLVLPTPSPSPAQEAAVRPRPRELPSPREETPEAPSPPATVSSPSPSPVETAAPIPPPTPIPSAPPLASPSPPEAPRGPVLDAGVLATLQPVAIGRAEGLPSQRALVLDDILEGPEWAWLRFTLKGGAREHVERVYWADGDIPNVAEAREGGDLRIVVPVPRKGVTRKARVTLEVRGEGRYTFSLSDPSFTTFLKKLWK